MNNVQDHQYDDIINYSRPVSTKRKHMSAMDRAAQFAPFAALTGLDEAMDEVSDSVNAEQPEIIKIFV